MKPVAIIYVALGMAGIFLGDITNDLLALGIRSEVISILSKGIGVGVLAVGVVAIQTKQELPPLPKDEDEPSL